MLAMQLRHLLPEWQEVLGMTTAPAARAGELAIVHPPTVAARDSRHGQHLLLRLDLTRGGRDHLAALRHVTLQDVVDRRRLELRAEPSQPLTEELLRGPRQRSVLD